MFSPAVIALIFRWVNFLIIVGAIAYFFHTRFLDVIRQQVLDKRLFFQNLYKKLEQAVSQNKKIIKEINEQQQTAAQLLQKAQYWSAAVTEDKKQRQELFQKRLKELSKQRDAQLDLFIVHQAQKRIIPKAIADAEQKLQQKFKQPAAQQKYIQELVSFMKKN